MENKKKERFSLLKNIGLKYIVAFWVAFCLFAGLIIINYVFIIGTSNRKAEVSGELEAFHVSEDFYDFMSLCDNALNYSGYTIERCIEHNTTIDNMKLYMEELSKAYTKTLYGEFDAIYCCYKGNLINGDGWVPPSDYNIKERLWYTEAIKKDGETAITNYKDAKTGKVIMTLSKLLKDKETVVAIDIGLEAIKHKLANRYDVNTGNIANDADEDKYYVKNEIRYEYVSFIVSETGNIAAASKPELVNTNAYKSGAFLNGIDMSQYDGQENFSCEKIYDGDNYILYFRHLYGGWYAVSAVNNDHTFSIHMSVLGMEIIAFIIAIFMLYILINHMIKKNKEATLSGIRFRSLANIYSSVYSFDLVNGTFEEIKCISDKVHNIAFKPYKNDTERLKETMRLATAEQDRDAIVEFVDLDTINERMKNTNTITHEFLGLAFGYARGRFIVEERDSAGNIMRLAWVVEIIDKEKKKLMKLEQERESVRSKLNSAASIFVSMHSIDLTNDTFEDIWCNNKLLQENLRDDITSAAKHLHNAVTNLVSENDIEKMLAFSDMDTLADRIGMSTTITEEFLSITNIYCRGRFIVENRDENGKAVGVLWAIEIIDKEKRDMLDATNRIMALSDIYMSIVELDLVSNCVAKEIKNVNPGVAKAVKMCKGNMAEVFNSIMQGLPESPSKQLALDFVNFDTIDERMKDTNTITVEYLSYGNLWVRGRFVVLKRDSKGKIKNILWSLENIDSEKRVMLKLEQDRIEADDANKAKSSFLSNMSHEIRTPINSIIGMNEMILRECEDENIIMYAQNAKVSSNTLLGIVNDILDFSKIEAGKLDIIEVDYDLSSALNDLVNMIRNRIENKGLKFIVDVSPDIPVIIHGDEVRIKQVITNILTNAAKYTEKGSVTMTVRGERNNEDNSLMLTVKIADTGIGIKPEDMKKLFSAFERIEEKRNRNIEGTGLGMNITQSLLSMMGSKLDVESVYGEGSTFGFTVKQGIVKDEPIGDFEKSYRNSSLGAKKYHEKFIAPDAHVLVVDDTSMNLTVFVSLLKKTKMKIDTADSGQRCLELTQQKKYDIIFLDHRMPNKDGVETLHDMRASETDLNHDTPVICLTANALSGARQQYIDAGFDDYLTKPIDPNKLEETIENYLPKELFKPYDENAVNNAVVETSAEEKDITPEPVEEKIIPDFVTEIEEINVASGLKYLGNEEMYMEVLKTYAGDLGGIVSDIEKFYWSGDLRSFTIKVHALKSSTRSIGGTELGDRAQELETAGDDGDKAFIDSRIEDFLISFRNLEEKLSPLVESNSDSGDLTPMTMEEVQAAYEKIKKALDAFEFNDADDIVAELNSHIVPESEQERCKALKQAADDFDYVAMADVFEN